MLKQFLLLLCFFALALPIKAPLAQTNQTQPAKTVYLLKPARVFDGVELHAGWVVLVNGDRIERVGPAAEITAPALAQALPAYSDEQLVRLIRYGVKRDGTSAIGMSSYTFWTLGGEDLRNIVAFVRAQPAAPVMQRRLDLPFRARLALARGKWKVSADEVDRRIPRWGDLPRRSIFERGRYLASVVCAECHGTDFRGNLVQGGPSLAVVAAYGPAEFQRLLRTGLAIGGRAIPDMSWMAQVHFDEGEISDLYGFLREYHHR
jgi:mono/diheme cytochrome c family protein